MPPIQHEKVAGEFELARQQAVAARKLARLERALDHEAHLLGIERLAQELIDRRRRQRLPGERRGYVEDENADDVGMGDAQGGEKGEALAAAVILGKREIDMDVGQGSLSVGGGADVEHAVPVLRRQMVQRIGPLGRVPRDRKHRSELVHCDLCNPVWQIEYLLSSRSRFDQFRLRRAPLPWLGPPASSI